MSILKIKRKLPPPRHHSPHVDPFYGYGYRPDWPSILSIAHDEADGGALFLITDRPCVTSGGGNVFPLAIAGIASVLSSAQVLPIKFRLVMGGAVPAGAMWRWGTGPSNLYDPITGHAPNAQAGDCFDTPGPYAPIGDALVIAAVAMGTACTLRFDQPVTLTGDPPDGTIVFNGLAPLAVVSLDATTLQFTLVAPVAAGDVWQITGQPVYISPVIANPAAGAF